MFERIRSRLVDDWHEAWRWWTTRLNALTTILLGYILAYPNAVPDLLKQLPDDLQPLVPWVVPICWGLLVQVARMTKQGPDGR
jgi:hypothetical protein